MKPEDEAPNIEGFEFYFTAFKELNSCRDVGMGLSPIPFTAIVDYARIYDVGEFEEFLELIRMMDEQFLDLQATEQEKKKDVGVKSGGSNSNKTHQNKR